MAPKKTAPKPTTAAPAPKHDGMKIIAMQVENVKKVSFARIRPDGNMVQVTGENASGKSTILDAIDWALCGMGNVPSAPIRKGSGSARIQLDLGDYKVERYFTHVEGGKTPFLSKLMVYGKNRESFPSPQSLLDRLMGDISFDPLEFVRMEPKKQVKTLRRLVTFKVDIDALEREKQEAYDKRRDAGRDLDAAKARLAPMQIPADDLPAKPIDTEALAKKLRDAADHNGRVNAAEAMIGALREQRKKEEEQAAVLRKEAEHALKLAQEIDGCTATIKYGTSAASNTLAKIDAEISKIVVQDRIDTAVVSAELSKAQSTNFAIQSREMYLSVKKQVEEAEREWARLDKIVKDKTTEREKAIAEAKMPIPNLSIGDGEVIYRGIPFTQASNAEQIRVSVALAIACNPKLRVLRIKDGSLLDHKSMEMIRTMAVEGDYQVWIERVAGDGKVGVTMVDGEATGEETERRVQ